MIELIQSIPGPNFLLYYVLYFVILLILFKHLLKVNDPTKDKVFPSISELSGYQISLLQNKKKTAEILKLMIFDLWHQKLIETDSEKKLISTDLSISNRANLNSLQKMILAKLPSRINPLISSLKNSLELREHIESSERKLIQLNLLKSQEANSQSKRYYFFYFILALAPGVIKLFLGLSRHKPVVLLIPLLVIALITVIALYPKKTTLLGRKFLKKAIADERAKLRQLSQDREEFPSTMNPVLTGALLGITSLFIFSEFSALSHSMPELDTTSSSDFSGGSDSNSSSGCSSCSSCGGCGGGD